MKRIFTLLICLLPLSVAANNSIVDEGTPGATLHSNIYGGYAFLLRADAERTLEFIAPEGHSMYVETVPVPPAVWLFTSGMMGLIGIARRRRSQV